MLLTSPLTIPLCRSFEISSALAVSLIDKIRPLASGFFYQGPIYVFEIICIYSI